MNKLKQIILIIIVLAITGGMSYWGITSKKATGLHTVSGTELELSRVINSGPIVILTYWHSTCPACKEQIAELAFVQMMFDSMFMQSGQLTGYVMGINVGDSDSEVKSYWMNINPLKYHTLAGGTLPTTATPTTEVYINGELVKQFIGLTKYDKFVQIIQSIVEEQ